MKENNHILYYIYLRVFTCGNIQSFFTIVKRSSEFVGHAFRQHSNMTSACQNDFAICKSNRAPVSMLKGAKLISE